MPVGGFMIISKSASIRTTVLVFKVYLLLVFGIISSTYRYRFIEEMNSRIVVYVASSGLG